MSPQHCFSGPDDPDYSVAPSTQASSILCQGHGVRPRQGDRVLSMALALGLPFLNVAGGSCLLLCQGLTLALW